MIIFLLSLLLLFSNISHATIFQAQSCSFEHVSQEVNNASSGDTILIPQGSCVWSKTLYLTKNLTLKGTGRQTTIIRDNGVSSGLFDLSSIGFSRLSNFSLTGIAGSYNGVIRIRSHNKRIDNVSFYLENDRHVIGVHGNLSNVVIDHSSFENKTRGINIFGSTSYWTDLSQYAPGTLNGVYIEDCIFYRSGVEVADLNYGGAYIFRYNSVVNGGNIIVHGADSGSRSGGYVEIYNNEFKNPGPIKDFAITLRGGSAIIFNNNISGLYNQAFKLQNWRTSYGSVNLPFHKDNQNRCSGSTTNPLDGNINPPKNGWPCKDQIGRGPNQISIPSYEWNNLWDNGLANFKLNNLGGVTNPSIFDHIKEGRDYFTDVEKPNYKPLQYPHPLITGIIENPEPVPETPEETPEDPVVEDPDQNGRPLDKHIPPEHLRKQN